MSGPRMAIALVATGALAWGLAAAASTPLRWHGDDAAELRLSWSARPERIESCRRLTDEELAARPAHMRQRVECEGRSATYELEVTIDGRVIERSIVHGGGLREDRPVMLLRDYPVSAGERTVRVSFTRREADTAGDSSDTDATDDREARDALRRRGRRLAALPPHLVLEQVIEFRAGEAMLVTVEQGTFMLREALGSRHAQPDR